MSLAAWLTDPGNKASILDALEEAKKRTWLLTDGLSDEALAKPACSYLSPPVWDLGHMANFEELWLVQHLQGRPELNPGDNDTYDAFAHPRPDRPQLDLLDRDGVRTYTAAVRALTRLGLSGIDLEADDLTRDGFVYWMLVLHEHQHQETLLQTMAMEPTFAPPTPRPLPSPEAQPPFAWVPIAGRDFDMGVPHGPGVYDNEAPPHPTHVAAFELANSPTTNGEYLEFLLAGGYDDPSLWSERGRQWLAEEPHHAPLYWSHDSTGWRRRTPLGSRPVDEVRDEILAHVTYFEAEAYAHWRGARLPSEAEWECAARLTGGRNPWGDAPATTRVANVDQLGYQPSTRGAYPAGAVADIHHLIGDVWEWCSSDFEAYPNSRAFPYPEYSEVFYGGDYKVLRGGSWASRAGCATGTFRNWDHPYRRQIFSGIRLARDVAD